MTYLDARQFVTLWNPPRLASVGKVRIGEEQHGRHVARRNPPRFLGDVEAIGWAGSSEDGDGAYLKPPLVKIGHQGAVYTVAGSSGTLTPGPLDHPAMFTSLYLYGSAVLDIDDQRLDLRFLDSAGVVQDHFTIVKDPDLIADFAAEPTSGTAPLEVTFTDLTLMQATEWTQTQ